jgi:hypothetical protein
MGWLGTTRLAVSLGPLLALACGSTGGDKVAGGVASNGAGGSSISGGAVSSYGGGSSEAGRAGSNVSGTGASASGGGENDGGAHPGAGVGNAAGEAGDDAGGVVSVTSGGMLRVAIDAKAIAVNPKTGALYAVVSSADPAYANELLELDEAGRVRSSVQIGSDPNTLAVSDDGTTMWVGLQATQQVMKVDLTGAKPVLGATFALPANDFGQVFPAGPMVVLAGTTTTLAISLRSTIGSPSFKGVRILEDGAALPLATPGHTGAARLVGGPPGYLFGFNDQTSGYEFYTLKAQADGVTQTAFTKLIEGAWDLLYIQPYVVAATGEVVDVSDLAAPTRAGKFSQSGLLEYDPQKKNVVMLSCGEPEISFSCNLASRHKLVLRRLDLATFTEIEFKPLGSELFEGISDFVRFGANRLAFIGKIDSSMVNPPAAIYLLEQP